jgi:hypothetical protein
MRKPKKRSFAELVSENKQQLLKDHAAMERIEDGVFCPNPPKGTLRSTSQNFIGSRGTLIPNVTRMRRGLLLLL